MESRAYGSMSFNTALALFLLAVAVICAHPKVGIGRVLASDTSGGTLARTMIPAALLLPTVLGWLVLVGYRHGLWEG